MARIKVNDVELAYEIGGSGSPLVLVHGSWSDPHGWDRVADGFARDFTVVRYDRRGHSDSERAPGTTRDDVRDLAALIEALDVAPAHVIGSSFGGVIAFQLAASSPELLRSLVSHEPPATSSSPRTTRRVARSTRLQRGRKR
jgi:pimeloyl-ACP methyl ester carboxylesterase